MAIRLYILLTFILFMILVLQNCTSDSSKSKKTHFLIHENDKIEIPSNKELLILEDEENYYLGSLMNVATDRAGNIYLFDDAQGSSFVIDNEGSYLKKILGAGRGPGEVLDFGSVTINEKQDQIVIADRQNMRIMLTDLDGNNLKIHTHNPSEVETPSQIVHYKGNEYFFLFSLSESQSLRKQKGIDDLFHIYDMNKGKRVKSFGDREEILSILEYGESSVSRNFTQLYVGDITFFKKNFMIYAPYVYSNKIIVFKKDKDNWILDSVINGTKLDRIPYKDLDPEDGAPDSGKNIFRTVGEIGRSLGFIHRRNVGIFVFNDEIIVSFFVEEFEQENTFYHELYAELYDNQFNFIGSDKLFSGKPGEVFFNIDWKDAEDNFYMTVRNGRHYVIKFSIENINISNDDI